MQWVRRSSLFVVIWQQLNRRPTDRQYPMPRIARRSFVQSVSVLLILSWQLSVVRAQDARLVVIGADSSLRENIGTSAASALQRAGWAVEVEGAPAESIARRLTDCYGGNKDACADLQTRSASRILAIEVVIDAPSDDEESVSLTAWLVDEQGVVTLAERRFCQQCTTPRLHATVDELMGYFVRESAGMASKSIIRIRSTPSGARVSVDDEPVGVTDLEYTVYPGRHRITIDKPGHRIELREVDAPLGATIELDVALTRESQPASQRGSALPWILGGAGIAASAGGIALMVLDSPDLDDQNRPNREFRNSFWPGVGLTAVGVGLIATSTWLFIKGRNKPNKGSAVTIDLREDELWIVGAGRF